VNKTISIAPVRKSVVVAATPQQAFEVFTGGIDRWWPKTHSIGATPPTQSVIEPFTGGRWYTRHEDGSDVIIGHVRVWQPGERLVVSWEISPQWQPEARAELASEVEVRFSDAGAGNTRVELEHRNFERMGEAGGAKMRNEVDNGWPTLMDLFAKEVSKGAHT
jgi:uncharacterized protein YndB with AHSA1/START domain